MSPPPPEGGPLVHDALPARLTPGLAEGRVCWELLSASSLYHLQQRLPGPGAIRCPQLEHLPLPRMMPPAVVPHGVLLG